MSAALSRYCLSVKASPKTSNASTILSNKMKYISLTTDGHFLSHSLQDKNTKWFSTDTGIFNKPVVRSVCTTTVTYKHQAVQALRSASLAPFHFCICSNGIFSKAKAIISSVGTVTPKLAPKATGARHQTIALVPGPTLKQMACFSSASWFSLTKVYRVIFGQFPLEPSQVGLNFLLNQQLLLLFLRQCILLGFPRSLSINSFL